MKKYFALLLAGVMEWHFLSRHAAALLPLLQHLLRPRKKKLRQKLPQKRKLKQKLPQQRLPQLRKLQLRSRLSRPASFTWLQTLRSRPTR